MENAAALPPTNPRFARTATESPFSRLVGMASSPLFEWLNVHDARQLMQASKVLREDVKEYKWGWNVDDKFDESLKIVNLQKWRACFPNAMSAVLSRSAVFGADDFVHLGGLRKLDLNGNSSITDAAFEHLRGINTLNMSYCHQVTDAAFEHLRGIQTLDMSYCTTITDAACEHLRGIQTLVMIRCDRITDAAFENFRGINTLDMSYCTDITDAACEHLRGIQTLVMTRCDRMTDAAFENFRGIQTLSMFGCRQSQIDAAQSILGEIPNFSWA